MAAFTEKAIIEAFVKLLNDRPLDKIKVKDVIDECGVNRSTFYYYFEDIYDLLNKVLEQEAERLAGPHVYEPESWVDGIIDAMSFAIDNKKAIFHIYKSVNREKLEKYLMDVTDSVLYEAVKTQTKDINASEDNLRLVTDIYKSVLTGLIFKWIEEGMTSEPMAIINKLGYMFDGNIRELVKRAEEYKD